MKPKRWLVLLIAAIAAACWASDGQTALPPAGKPVSPARSAIGGDAPRTLSARCQLRGDVDVLVRCEVPAIDPAGLMIVEVVPEGTPVKKGDVLLRFDTSALEDRQMEQEVRVMKALAAAVKAAGAHEVAKIAKEEFEQGAYAAQEQALQMEIALAERRYREIEDALSGMRGAREKGNPNEPGAKALPSQIEGFEIRSMQLKSELALAQRKLAVLQKFTRPKALLELEAAIRGTDAEHRAAKLDHELQVTRMRLIRSQIEKCTVRAPQDGQVYHVTAPDAQTGRPVPIAQGVRIRPFHEILRLRDPRQMRAVARVTASQAAAIRPGMAATVTLDALRDLTLTGVVDKIREFTPAAASGPAHEVGVRIADPPPTLRPGLTGSLRIEIP